MLDRAALGEFAAVTRCNLGQARVGVVRCMVRHGAQCTLPQAKTPGESGEKPGAVAPGTWQHVVLSRSQPPRPARTQTRAVRRLDFTSAQYLKAARWSSLSATSFRPSAAGRPRPGPCRLPLRAS